MEQKHHNQQRSNSPAIPDFARASLALVVRVGDWKLLTDPNGPVEELYHLADDIGETTNLAASQPEMVKSLQVE